MDHARGMEAVKQEMAWECPVCGNRCCTETKEQYISCTVRCTKCDSSIGLSFITGTLSVVYSEVPEEDWADTKKKPCTSVCINELETEIHHCDLKEGHDGPHQETDYDDRLDAFKVFEWNDNFESPDGAQGSGVGRGGQPG